MRRLPRRSSIPKPKAAPTPTPVRFRLILDVFWESPDAMYGFWGDVARGFSNTISLHKKVEWPQVPDPGDEIVLTSAVGETVALTTYSSSSTLVFAAIVENEKAEYLATIGG